MLLPRLIGGPALPRGVVFGLGAHAAGPARAAQVGPTEGAIAGLVMAFAGLLNVLSARVTATALGALNCGGFNKCLGKIGSLRLLMSHQTWPFQNGAVISTPP